MPNFSIAIGVALLLVGIAGYLYGMSSGAASVTALIPAFIGVVLLVLGIAARAKESLRKHLMHVAVIVGLLGAIAPLVRLVPRMGELSMTAAVVSQILTVCLCLLFVIAAVRSFIAARSAR